MGMASIAAGILLAHVDDSGFGVRDLDLERSNQRVFGFDRYLIRLVLDLDPDRIPYGHGCRLRAPIESWMDPRGPRAGLGRDFVGRVFPRHRMRLMARF